MIHQTLARARRHRRAQHDEPWTAEHPALLREDAAAIDRAFLIPIAEILDRAHAELAPSELAALLLAVRRAADRPDASPLTGPLPIGVEQRLGSVERLLGIATQQAEDHYARIQERLREHVEDVAARPRGAALSA